MFRNTCKLLMATVVIGGSVSAQSVVQVVAQNVNLLVEESNGSAKKAKEPIHTVAQNLVAPAPNRSAGAESVAVAVADAAAKASGTVPIYRVTVVSRTTKALNYGHRTEPTMVDLKGTVLLPEARGEAMVQSQRGSTVLDVKFNHVEAPTRFGPQFLTYVLWAITPEGRPSNLGEVVLNGSDKGKLTISTNLQAFALIVTAEPHFSVSQPSDIVVMENFVRADTVGKVEEVNANVELLPRNSYTYDVASPASLAETPKVSMKEYETTLALYQAQNAIQMAQAADAERYAQPSLQKALQLYQQALTYKTAKSDSKQVVATAREATQAAEDARMIAVKRAPVDNLRRAN